MRWRFGLVSFCVALLLCISPTAQGQNSTLISPISEPLWQALLPIATDLPGSYDLFISNLISQVGTLTTNNGSLSASNLSLLDSNNSLTLENVGLRASLKASREAEARSESKSTLLQKDLSDSIASTIRAQADAKALELENKVLKIGGSVLLVVAVVVAGYEGGRALRWW